MTTMTFLVNGEASGRTKSAAWVTIKEIEGGLLSFKVVQSGGSMGNLRGVYFDVTDERILSTLRVHTVSNDIHIGDNAINRLESVTRMDGSPYDGKDYDVRLDVEELGAGKEGVSSYSFILNSTQQALSLSDFTNIQLDYAAAHVGSDVKNGDDYSYRWLYMGLA